MKYILAITFLITACSVNDVRINGYAKPCNLKNFIYLSDSSADVIQKIGTPSFIDNDNKIYYYFGLSGVDDPISSFRPKTREMLKIEFLYSGKVANISCDIKKFTT